MDDTGMGEREEYVGCRNWALNIRSLKETQTPIKTGRDEDLSIHQACYQLYPWRERNKWLSRSEYDDKHAALAVTLLQAEFFLTVDGAQKAISARLARFMKEPNNQFDKNAIKVETSDGKHLGYVAKELAKEINEKLPEKRRVHYTVYGGLGKNYGMEITINVKQ
eukprot:g26606.t1